MSQPRLSLLSQTGSSSVKLKGSDDKALRVFSRLPVELLNIIFDFTADENFDSKIFVSEKFSQDMMSDFLPVSDEHSKSNHYTKVGRDFFEMLSIITLLNHVVRGEYKEANTMLTKGGPLFLLRKGTVTDFSGRLHYQGAPYQLARGAGDIHVFSKNHKKVVEGMAEMIESHFSRLPFRAKQIKKILKRQYQNQFPKALPEKEAKRSASDIAALHEVLNSIKIASDQSCDEASFVDDRIQERIWDEKVENKIQDSKLYNIHQKLLMASSKVAFDKAFSELEVYVLTAKILSKRRREEKNGFLNVLKAIYRFRNHMEPKERIKSGLHYNYQLSQEADRLYVQHHLQTVLQNSFYEEKVLGYIDRFRPACDGQLWAQGTSHIWNFDEICCRSLELRIGGGWHFPLSTLNENPRLGYNCFAECTRKRYREISYVDFGWDHYFEVIVDRHRAASSKIPRLTQAPSFFQRSSKLLTTPKKSPSKHSLSNR